MSTKTFYLDEVIQMLHVGADNIGDEDQLIELAEDLARVLTKHFGGDIDSVNIHCRIHGGIEDNAIVSISANGEVPSDGGIYADFDKDVPVEEFMEDVNEESYELR